MDSRNKITQDMLQPKVERYFSDEEGSSDYLFELSDNDSDSPDFRQKFWLGEMNVNKRGHAQITMETIHVMMPAVLDAFFLLVQ